MLVVDLVTVGDWPVNLGPDGSVKQHPGSVVVVSGSLIVVSRLAVPEHVCWGFGWFGVLVFIHETIVSPTWRYCASIQPLPSVQTRCSGVTLTDPVEVSIRR